MRHDRFVLLALSAVALAAGGPAQARNAPRTQPPATQPAQSGTLTTVHKPVPPRTASRHGNGGVFAAVAGEALAMSGLMMMGSSHPVSPE